MGTREKLIMMMGFGLQKKKEWILWRVAINIWKKYQRGKGKKAWTQGLRSKIGGLAFRFSFFEIERKRETNMGNEPFFLLIHCAGSITIRIFFFWPDITIRIELRLNHKWLIGRIHINFHNTTHVFLYKKN